jgi:hypothetical protein
MLPHTSRPCTIIFAFVVSTKFNTSQSNVYTLQGHAACFTMPQINSQLLYSLQTSIDSPDHRHYRLLRRRLRQRRGRQKILRWLRVYCQRWSTWSTHKEHTVAFSSMESEYMARKQFFQELQIPSAIRPFPLLTDSQTALEISDNPAKYCQAKHIDVRCHAARHYIHDGKIQIDYIPSKQRNSYEAFD